MPVAEESNDGLHRNGEPLTDAEFREAAEHIWLNALLCVRPPESFLIQIGEMVLEKIKSSDLRTCPFGGYEGSRAAILYVNMS